MKPLLTAAAVTVVVVLLAGGFLLFFNTPLQQGSTTSNGTSTTASSSSTFMTSSSTSTALSNGLQLRLSLNATSIMPHGAVRVTVSEYNIKSVANNVSAAKIWKLNGLSLGACGTDALPFGVAVYRGQYDSGNVSQGNQLRNFPVVPCPMLLRYVTGYLFQPLSDSAVILPSSDASPTIMSANVTVRGEYAGQTLQALSPGAYTVVAGDEWGALEVLHFSVSGQTQTSTTTAANGNGTLSAQIGIGPTAPVCRANATVGPASSPYASIEAVIILPSGHNMTVPISWHSNGCVVSGSVQASLAPGTYQLSLSSCIFMGCGSALPKSFTIFSGQTTTLTISIDTGIR